MRTVADCDAMVVEALKGHTDAVNFIRLITNALHTWDDLIDQDKPLRAKDINGCFWQLLITLPNNPFYRANIDRLQPILVNSILNWIAATKLEDEIMLGLKSSDYLAVTYGARSAYKDIVLHTAVLLYGFEYAQEIAHRILLHWQGATFEEYKEQLVKQYEDAEPRRHVD